MILKNIKKFLLISVLLFLFFDLNFAYAEPTWTIPDLQIEFPQAVFTRSVDCSEPDSQGSQTCTVPWLSDYIVSVYKYAVGIVGIVAVVVIMYGGVIWMMSLGNSSRVTEARSWIAAALTGLVLVFGSYTILYLINPELIKLKPIEIKTVNPKVITSQNAIPSCSTSTIEIVSAGDSVYVDKNCPAGKTKVDNSFCQGTTNADKEVCCCQTNPSWEYQPGQGIENQKSDASPSLISLIDCMRKYLPAGVGKISSISDNNHMGAKITECHISDCKTKYTGDNSCQHACFSCHYGGNEFNQSHAVDFGDEIYKDLIMEAAGKCDDYVGYILDEGNHIHVSTTLCSKN